MAVVCWSPPTVLADSELLTAARRGDLFRVKALLAAKADVNEARQDGATALMAASTTGHQAIVRKLHDALPELRVLVGRWAPVDLADEDRAILVEAGANHVESTIVETRDQLRTLATHERQRSEPAVSPQPAATR